MDNLENKITVIVETPKGCGHKYDYDAITNQFRLKKLLPAGMVFPFDFGFIPRYSWGRRRSAGCADHIGDQYFSGLCDRLPADRSF